MQTASAQSSLSQAVKFLEKKFKVPYDQSVGGGIFRELINLTPSNHHFKSLAHNPTILGLFFSILNQWATLTIVRAGQEKYMESVLTRGVLSTWSQEDTDECCRFYMDAVLRTESELTDIKAFWDRTYVTRAATVLLEVLSQLCSKCSDKMMAQLLEFLEKLYNSPQKEYYLQAASLVRRMLSNYPAKWHHELLLKLLAFPLPDLEKVNIQRDLPDPVGMLSALPCSYSTNSGSSYPEVEQLIAQSKISDTSLAALNRLLCCSSQGLLTSEQKRWLGDFIWHDGKPRLPAYWLDTVFLKLPSQHEEDEVRYLCRSIANKISNDTSGAIRFPGGRDVFNELILF